MVELIESKFRDQIIELMSNLEKKRTHCANADWKKPDDNHKISTSIWCAKKKENTEICFNYASPLCLQIN